MRFVQGVRPVKFTYAYKTSDGTRHEAAMTAAQLNDLWEKRNESLRQMGVKLVAMPE